MHELDQTLSPYLSLKILQDLKFKKYHMIQQQAVKQKSKPKVQYETYKKIKMLGEGTYGKAYLVQCQSDKVRFKATSIQFYQSLCVIKQINMTQMPQNQKKQTLQQARILQALQHPNIVRFRQVYTTKKGRLCIVMDYADDGQLAEKIATAKQNQRFFSEQTILSWFTQICMALKHVHDRKILHRDLKAQNVFLTKTGVVKLGDFGIAYCLNHTYQNAKTMVGTPYYLSPQIIQNRPYSFKSDMWSLGVLLYEMCSLCPPFEASNLHYLALKIVRNKAPSIPDHYSLELKNICANLLTKDPVKRVGINELLRKEMTNECRQGYFKEMGSIIYYREFVLNRIQSFNSAQFSIIAQNVLQNLEKSGGITSAVSKSILKQQKLNKAKSNNNKGKMKAQVAQKKSVYQQQKTNASGSKKHSPKGNERPGWNKQQVNKKQQGPQQDEDATNYATIIAEQRKKQQQAQQQLRKFYDQNRKKMKEQMKKKKKQMQGKGQQNVTWVGETSFKMKQDSDFPSLSTKQSIENQIKGGKSKEVQIPSSIQSKKIAISKNQLIQSSAIQAPKNKAKQISNNNKYQGKLSDIKKMLKSEKNTKQPQCQIFVKEQALQEVNKRRQMIEKQEQQALKSANQTQKEIEFNLSDDDYQNSNDNEEKKQAKQEGQENQYDNEQQFQQQQQQLQDADFNITQTLNFDQ